MKIENEDIDITTLAKHYEEAHSSPRSAYESFRQLRRKWDESKTGLWIVYVKAYNWDKSQDMELVSSGFTESETLKDGDIVCLNGVKMEVRND